MENPHFEQPGRLKKAEERLAQAREALLQQISKIQTKARTVPGSSMPRQAHRWDSSVQIQKGSSPHGNGLSLGLGRRFVSLFTSSRWVKWLRK